MRGPIQARPGKGTRLCRAAAGSGDSSAPETALRAGIGPSIIHSFASQQERGPGMLGATRPCVPRAGCARIHSCWVEIQLAAAPPSRLSLLEGSPARPAEEQQPGAAVEVFCTGFSPAHPSGIERAAQGCARPERGSGAGVEELRSGLCPEPG